MARARLMRGRSKSSPPRPRPSHSTATSARCTTLGPLAMAAARPGSVYLWRVAGREVQRVWGGGCGGLWGGIAWVLGCLLWTAHCSPC